jgi:hypothetical protein
MSTSLDLPPRPNPNNGHQQRNSDEAGSMPWLSSNAKERAAEI